MTSSMISRHASSRDHDEHEFGTLAAFSTLHAAGELVDELRESQSAVVDDTSMMDGSRDVDRSSVRRSSLSVATSRTSSPSPVDRRPSPSPPPAHRPSTDPQDDNKPKEPQSPALFDVDNTSSTLPVRSTCFDAGCTSLSPDVVQQTGEAVFEDQSMTNSSTVPLSSAVELLRRTERPASGSELTKQPVNLKLNGLVQLDEGPLDLSISGRATTATDVVSDSWRLRSSKSQTLSSASLAKLVRRFGTTSTSASVSTSSSSAFVISDGTAGHNTSSLQPRPGAGPHSTTLFNPPPTTLCSPSPSRWRRDSFWSSGGWLAGATPERHDGRKRPLTTAISANDRRQLPRDMQSGKLNRKLFSDRRKSSSYRSATRLRCDEKSSTVGQLSSSGALKVQTSRALCVDVAATAKVKDDSRSPSSPKRPRTDSSRDAAARSDCEKTQRHDKTRRHEVDGDDAMSARHNLTSLQCGSCGSKFDSLFRLTVHLEETGHTPASDVAVLPTPSPTESPSSTDRKPTVASLSPVSAPQRLVRGQDVWLARGVEQTDRILRCIQCNAAARSLAELTLHMVHTKHYINIVGPATSSNNNVSQPQKTRRDDSVAPNILNGLRISSNKDTRRRRDIHDSPCTTNLAVDDLTTSQQRSSYLQSCAGRQLVTDNSGTVKDSGSTYSEEPVDVRSVTNHRRSSQRSVAFSVRNLIASEADDDGGSRCSRPGSATDVTPCDGRSMTSSVGPEVTSSSDRRSALVDSRVATVAE